VTAQQNNLPVLLFVL